MEVLNVDYTKLGFPDLQPSNSRVVTFSDLFESELYPGMHLAVNKRVLPHWHHGIYIGKEDGKHVIVDMNGPDKSSVKIGMRLLDQFLNGVHEIRVVEYDDDTAANRQIAVLRAIAACAPDAVQPLYDVLASNCECFAFWCRTNRYVSDFVLPAPSPQYTSFKGY